MSNNHDFPLFFKIAFPLVISGLIGLFTGIIPVYVFIAMLIALYVILCVANSMDNGGRIRK